MKQVFLEKAFWLCGNFPGICRRSYFGQWLICCLQKQGDGDKENAAKRKAVKRILQYFELPQREVFEKDLIDFVKNFTHRSPVRFRECSSRIESGTDWGRTCHKSLVESPGRLCAFVNYSRKYELDQVTRNSLILLALELAKELRCFASLLDGLDDGDILHSTADHFRQRAKNLEGLYRNCGRLPQHYNHERVDHALRQTSEGRRLADKIASWIFTPEWNFKLDDSGHPNAECLLKDLNINEDKLFEIIASITSIQTLQKMGFQIVSCDIGKDKPVIKLQKDDLFCQVRKNFDDQDYKVNDELAYYRKVASEPTGLQPDIVYKFWKKGVDPVYRLGDAKNYGRSTNSSINYPIALYAMLHYLIAYHRALGIADEKDVMPLLMPPKDGENDEKMTAVRDDKRIVLFFSNPGKEDKNNKCYHQPGDNGKNHPILFAYGAEAQTDDEGNSTLADFFDAAIKELERKS